MTRIAEATLDKLVIYEGMGIFAAFSGQPTSVVSTFDKVHHQLIIQKNFFLKLPQRQTYSLDHLLRIELEEKGTLCRIVVVFSSSDRVPLNEVYATDKLQKEDCIEKSRIFLAPITQKNKNFY